MAQLRVYAIEVHWAPSFLSKSGILLVPLPGSGYRGFRERRLGLDGAIDVILCKFPFQGPSFVSRDGFRA